MKTNSNRIHLTAQTAELLAPTLPVGIVAVDHLCRRSPWAAGTIKRIVRQSLTASPPLLKERKITHQNQVVSTLVWTRAGLQALLNALPDDHVLRRIDPKSVYATDSQAIQFQLRAAAADHFFRRQAFTQ